MVSLQSRIRMFIIFSLISYIIIAVSLFVINHHLGNQIQVGSESGVYLDRIIIFAIVMIIVGFAVGVYTLIFTYIRGINRYRELARRLNSLSDIGTFNLRSIEFPSEDEFGGIGGHFNTILSRLAAFDELKTQRIKMERQKFTILAGILDVPVLFISLDGTEKIVKFYNRKFEQLFIKKEGEDIYYEISNTSLEALSAQCTAPAAKNFAPLFDRSLIEAIDASVNVLSPSTVKRDFCSMSGKEKYHSEKLDIIPVWDDQNQVGDILILFNNTRKK